MEDIRTLCHRCAHDTRCAGYTLQQIKNQIKEECDKCKRQGYSYYLIKKGGR